MNKANLVAFGVSLLTGWAGVQYCYQHSFLKRAATYVVPTRGMASSPTGDSASIPFDPGEVPSSETLQTLADTIVP